MGLLAQAGFALLVGWGAMMASVVLWGVVIKYVWWWSTGFRTTKPCKPFPPLQNLPTDPLRPMLNKKEFPTEADAVVIGSGPAGLVTAIMLGRQGKSVIVLEQHDRMGGGLHTFQEQGFEFDTGFFYSGGVESGQMFRSIIDSLTEGFGGRFGGGVQWTRIQDGPYNPGVCETIEFLDDSCNTVFQVPSGSSNWVNALKRRFPSKVDHDAIDKFSKDVERAGKRSLAVQVWRTLPPRLRSITRWMIKPIVEQAQWSARKAMNMLTSNTELISLLTYRSLACLGVCPSEAGYNMVTGMQYHFSDGASYPDGGPTSLCLGLLYELNKTRGRVMVNSSVSKILVEDNEVVGVEFTKRKNSPPQTAPDGKFTTIYESEELVLSNNFVRVKCPIVVSTIGLQNTTEDLLEPEDVDPAIKDKINKLEATDGHMFVFVGLDGDPDELELPRTSHMIFSELDMEEGVKNFKKEGLEGLCSDCTFGFTYITFPSAKDNDYQHRHPGKSTAVIVAGDIQWDWFAEWAESSPKRRGREYAAFKERIGERLLDIMYERYPRLRDKVLYISVASPLDTSFYLGKRVGESYGLKMTPDKIKANLDWLAPQIAGMPDGLFWAGQDITSYGFAPSVISGLMCAATIEGPVFWFRIIPMLGGVFNTLRMILQGWILSE